MTVPWLKPRRKPPKNNTVQYCTVQYCTILYSTVQYCTVLYCTVHYINGLYNTCPLLYSTGQYCTVLYSTVQYCTVLYSTVQTGSVLAGSTGSVAPRFRFHRFGSVDQFHRFRFWSVRVSGSRLGSYISCRLLWQSDIFRRFVFHRLFWVIFDKKRSCFEEQLLFE